MAPVVHLLHGIHTSRSSRRLADLAGVVESASGFKTVYHEYGNILALQTRYLNPIIAERLLPEIGDGDILVGHSNGNAIWLRCLRLGAPASGMVLLNAALDDSIVFPSQLKWAHVYYNKGDEAVPVAAWAPKILLDPLWGDMGRDGYLGRDARVKNFDCGAPERPPLSGHSAIIEPPAAIFWAHRWGARIGAEINAL